MLRTKLSFIILSLMTKLQRQTNLNDTSYYTYSNLYTARDYEENLNNSDAASTLSIEYIDMVTAKILGKGILNAVYSQDISLNVERNDFFTKESHSNATSKHMQTNDVLINEDNMLFFIRFYASIMRNYLLDSVSRCLGLPTLDFLL
ncbi:hypothetical protein H312_01733 [Anncaliia algerae PRA339]|uniref:Uncharacterized protein n=1 Tax=Anncaliia algerae PRA339 TaxID=1288291 RepID=A0A059F102_9MICR|nr:hypothetical protein H312_01733 [Anncaliia algerae PRA339]